MIQVEEEPAELTKEFKGVLENCVFCQKSTTHWHRATNTPICPSCAFSHNVWEIPAAKQIANTQPT